MPPLDVRRVCAHIFDKLYSTKAEREQDALVQLFIRYGRTMLAYRAFSDERVKFVIGFPFPTPVIRAIALVNDRALLASYDLDSSMWLEDEHPGEALQIVLMRMHAAFPECFRR